MRFNNYHKTSSFMQDNVCPRKAKRRFLNAFKKREPRELNSQVLNEDRRWVRDVMQIWANDMMVDFAQAVMVFKTGDIPAMQKMHRRISDKFHKEFNTWTPEKQAWWNEANPKGHPVTKLATMGSADFRTVVIDSFIRACGCRHPKDTVSLKLESKEAA